jgi:hypothetical protein
VVAKLATLVEPFAGSTLDTTRWTVANGAPTVLSDQGAQLPCTTSYPQITTTGWDVTNSHISGCFTPPTLVAGASLTLALQQASTTFVSWNLSIITGGTALLTARKTVSGTNDDVVVSYDSTQHLWWRISEQNGYVHWETSPTGRMWIHQRSAPTSPIDLSNVTVLIQCGTTGEANWVAYGDGLYGDGVYGGGP